MTGINYLLASAIVFAAICLIMWMFRKNKKDEKEFEKDLLESEIIPKKYEENGMQT